MAKAIATCLTLKGTDSKTIHRTMRDPMWDHSSRTAADTAARRARGNEDSCDRRTSEGRARSSRRRTTRDPKRDHSSRTAAQMTARRARGNKGAFKRDIIALMFRNETTHADDCRCRTSHHDNRVWGTAVKSMIRRVSDQCTTDGRAGCWGLIDCEKSVCESRESQRECDTLSQLQTPRQLVVLAQPP